jgi:hypothetical protein
MGEDELDINSHKGELWNEVERLRAENERLRGLVDEPYRDRPRTTPLRAFLGILPAESNDDKPR